MAADGRGPCYSAPHVPREGDLAGGLGREGLSGAHARDATPAGGPITIEAIRAALAEHGNKAAAGRVFGRDRYWIARELARAAIRGDAPEHGLTKPVPDGFTVKGYSNYYNADGVLSGQWIKTRADDEARAAMIRAAFEDAAHDLPRLAPVAPPAVTNANLCNLYTLTDAHIGALAWHREGGADWDLGIAERTLSGCFAAMVEGAPRARTAVVNIQGDFLHIDGLLPVTPASRHVLDADSRFPKVATVAVRTIRRILALALARHDTVRLIICEGNHDEASSVWLRIMFAALYEDEPRVTVDDAVLPFYVHQHGRVMLGFHHGHKVKNEQLPGLFAAQFPGMWGATDKRYAHCGHRHHVDEREYSGMTVVQHPTLAARDAYAARGGWIAGRAAQAVTYHERFGQVGRNVVTPEMLEEAA